MWHASWYEQSTWAGSLVPESGVGGVAFDEVREGFVFDFTGPGRLLTQTRRLHSSGGSVASDDLLGPAALAPEDHQHIRCGVVATEGHRV